VKFKDIDSGLGNFIASIKLAVKNIVKNIKILFCKLRGFKHEEERDYLSYEPINIVKKGVLLDSRMSANINIVGEKHVDYIREWYRDKHGKVRLMLKDKDNSYIFTKTTVYPTEFTIIFGDLPENRIRVENNYSERIDFKTHEVLPFTKEEYSSEPLIVQNLQVDFSKGINEMRLRYDTTHSTVRNATEEDIFLAVKSKIKSDIDYTELNEAMTGIKNDGYITYDGKTLKKNCVCRKCGYPVFRKTAFEKPVCINHGELEYYDVIRLNNIKYETTLRNTLNELKERCEEK
jgi:hypothetical protein